MIAISISGDTEIEVDQAAQRAGVTPEQWLRTVVAAALARDPLGDWPGTWVASPERGKALSV